MDGIYHPLLKDKLKYKDTSGCLFFGRIGETEDFLVFIFYYFFIIFMEKSENSYEILLRLRTFLKIFIFDIILLLFSIQKI